MKKTLLSLLLVCTSLNCWAAIIPPVPDVAATAFLIKDAQSGQLLGEKNLNATIEPASLTKLMTAYITFKALKSEQLKLDQLLTVSENAKNTEGSRMFLDPRVAVSVDDLLKGVIVQSGNDACVVLAEHLSGSENSFAVLMNQEAQKLGMNNSHFDNSTGLPSENQYTTVNDLYLLATAIIKDFPEFYTLYSLKEFTYNGIKQPNRNLLLYRDPSVDGLKTGYTSSAGYNLIATSNRNGRRVISIVIGAANEQSRANESSKLLNWALQFYETPKIASANEVLAHVKIYKGKSNKIAVGFTEDAYFTVPLGQSKNIEPLLETTQPIIAPISKGQKMGVLKIKIAENIVEERDVIALDDVEEAGFFFRLWDSLILWVSYLFK